MIQNHHSPHPPRLALIGVTGYASIYWQHVRQWIVAGVVQLKAAVVVNPADSSGALDAMRAHGTRIYSSYEGMFRAEAGEVDLCLIPTGIAWHARMTVAALDAGMNVLVEKPLAGSVEDVRAMREAEARSGRWVAVGFQDMYSEEALWLKNILCAGGIGTVHRVRMVGLWPRPVSYFTRNQWAGKLVADGAPVLDSPLNNAFAHFVNLCFFLAGGAPGVSAAVRPTRAHLWRAHSIESFDTAFVQGESTEQVKFEFFVSHAGPRLREPEIRIEGTSGVAEWHHGGPVALFPAGERPIIRPLAGNTETRRTMFGAVLGKLADPGRFVCTTAMAEKHTDFIVRLHRAATIQQISPAAVSWQVGSDGKDSSTPCIHGIDDAFRLLPSLPADPTGGFLRRPGFFEAISGFRPPAVELTPPFPLSVEG